MVKWQTCRNGYMEKFQNGMLFFSYFKLILSHPFINERYGSEEVCPHQSIIHSCPYHPLQIYLPLPLPLPLLNLHIFPHIRLKLNPFICLLLLFTSFYTHYIPLCITLSHELRTPLHIHIHLHIRLPILHEIFTPLHLHLCINPFHHITISPCEHGCVFSVTFSHICFAIALYQCI